MWVTNKHSSTYGTAHLLTTSRLWEQHDLTRFWNHSHQSLSLHEIPMTSISTSMYTWDINLMSCSYMMACTNSMHAHLHKQCMCASLLCTNWTSVHFSHSLYVSLPCTLAVKWISNTYTVNQIATYVCVYLVLNRKHIVQLISFYRLKNIANSVNTYIWMHMHVLLTNLFVWVNPMCAHDKFASVVHV